MIPAMPGPEIELTSFDGTRGSGREGDMSYSPANAMANVVPAVAMLRLPSQSHSDRPSAVQSLDDRFDVAGIGSSGEVQRESLMVTSSCMDMQASTEDTVDMADAPIAAKYRGRRPSMVELAVKQPADLTLQDKLQFQRLLLRLAKAPSYRVERRIQSIAKAYSIPVEILCQPSYILISFGDFGVTSPITARDGTVGGSESLQNTFFLKVEQSYNMGKLQDVDYLATQIAIISDLFRVDPSAESRIDMGISRTASIAEDRGNWFTRHFPDHWRRSIAYYHHTYLQRPAFALPDEEASTISNFIKELDDIIARPYDVSRVFRIFSYGLQAGIAAVLLFYGTWLDGVASGFLGLIVGAIIVEFERRKLYAVEVTVSFIVCVLSQFIMKRLAKADDYCIGVITLSPLLPLYPGVAVTLSMLELASQNMNAGSVRLFFSFVRSLMLGFGLTLGARLIKFVTGEAIEARCPSLGRHFSMWFFVLIVPFSALVCIQLKAHVRQWPMMLATSVVAIMAFHGASQVFSRDMTNAIASFAIGLFANTVARRTNDIAMASILAGIIFLAPGSIGIIGFFELLSASNSAPTAGSTSTSGANFALDISVKAISLALGLYLSTLVAFPMAELVRKKPKKELRSPRHYRTEVAVRRLQQDQSYAMISF